MNILLHRVTGKLTFKNTLYNGQMPEFKAKLSDAEIAAVLSHMRASSAAGGQDRHRDRQG